MPRAAVAPTVRGPIFYLAVLRGTGGTMGRDRASAVFGGAHISSREADTASAPRRARCGPGDTLAHALVAEERLLIRSAAAALVPEGRALLCTPARVRACPCTDPRIRFPPVSALYGSPRAREPKKLILKSTHAHPHFYARGPAAAPRLLPPAEKPGRAPRERLVRRARRPTPSG